MNKESTIIFRLTEDLKEKIKLRSKSKEISVASIIRLAIIKYLEDEK